MKNIFTLFCFVIGTQFCFGQDWSWEITEVGKKKNGKIPLEMVMIEKFETTEKAASGELTIYVTMDFIKNKIYPNMPSDRKERLKDLKGLRFDKNPSFWQSDQFIHPY